MAIKVEALCYRYRTFQKSDGLSGAFKDFFNRKYVYKDALKNVSFHLERGSITGLIGPNGAGKTTLIKTLTGLIQPQSGTVSVLGYTPYRKDRNYLKQIGVVLGQKSQLIWDLPPKDTFETLRVIYGVSKEDFKSRLHMFSELLNLGNHIHTPTRNLSLGERMKCEIIASLLHDPKVLFLDEPTIGLDFHSQKAIRDFLKKITLDLGITIIITSHYLADIEKLCDQLCVLKDGAICYQGSVEHLIDKCSPNVRIDLLTDQEQSSIQCEPQDLTETLKELTSKYVIRDIKINKCSLEDAIYAVLEHP